MPTTREHSSCLEASRATALAAHSAAGLAAAAGLREPARLLRSCEALARAATAALLSTGKGASDVHRGTRLAADQSAGTGALGQAAVFSADASGSAASASAAKRKKKKKKKCGVSSEHMVIDADRIAGGVSVVAAVPAVVAPARVLEKKPSRERSPRRGGSQTPLSSSSASPSSATSPAVLADKGAFFIGQAAVLEGLVSRPELSGSRVTLRSWDGVSSRWAVTLDSTAESIRVKAQSLKPSAFVPGAPAAGAGT